MNNLPDFTFEFPDPFAPKKKTKKKKRRKK